MKYEVTFKKCGMGHKFNEGWENEIVEAKDRAEAQKQIKQKHGKVAIKGIYSRFWL